MSGCLCGLACSIETQRRWRLFLDAYDRSLLTDEELPRRVMAWTLLHDFGSDAVTELIEKASVSTPVASLDELEQILWPDLSSPSGA